MKILLATDGSDSALKASDFLLRFPFPKDAVATVITVVDEQLISEWADESLTNEHHEMLRDTRELVYEEGKQLLAREAKRLRSAGWAGATQVRTGDPAEEIIQAAGELDTDLVVLGSHGTTGIKHFLLGSVSSKVLEHAPCSVLIVKGLGETEPGLEPATVNTGTPTEPRPCHVLVAYDNSGPSRKVVELCATLPLGPKAEVTAVTVLPMITFYRQDIRQRLDPVWQQKKHLAKVALDDAVTALRWSTPNISARLIEGSSVSHEILDAARNAGSSLIMLGCTGGGAVERFLLGSTTSRIARHAPCSVWAVRG